MKVLRFNLGFSLFVVVSQAMGVIQTIQYKALLPVFQGTAE
jgi:hypothetical protein